MNAFKNTGIDWLGKIPVSWSVQRLKNVLQERNVSNNPIKTKTILSLTNDRGVIPYEEKGEVGNKAKEDLHAYKLAYPDDIVLNSMNVFIGSVALSAYYGCVSPVYYMLHVRSPKDSIRYFNYLFQTSQLQKKLHGYGNGIMDIRMRIQMSKLNTVLLPVPPAQIQHNIADYLDKVVINIDQVIKQEKKSIAKLEEYKLSLINKVVTEGIKSTASFQNTGMKWLKTIPSNWQLIKFKFCATVKPNLVSPENYLDYLQIAPDCIEKNSCKLIMQKTVRDAGVISENHLFHKGQILYSKIRPTLNKVIIAPSDGLCSADMYPIETTNNPQFLVYVMLSSYFSSQVGLVVSTRVKMPKINQNELNNIWIALPPLMEQNQIADYLSKKCTAIDHLISTKRAMINKFIEYKQALIYEVVTGKKEV